MARILKNEYNDHAITIGGDGDDGELLLVKGKRHGFIWCGRKNERPMIFSGPATLRKLAKAILAEVGDK